MICTSLLMLEMWAFKKRSPLVTAPLSSIYDGKKRCLDSIDIECDGIKVVSGVM